MIAIGVVGFLIDVGAPQVEAFVHRREDCGEFNEFERVGRQFVRNGQSFAAIEDIDLTIADKEFVALVGPSGCGKTPACALLPASRCRRRPRPGGGVPVSGPGRHRRGVQAVRVFPWKTVANNIGSACATSAFEDGENARIAAVIRLMGLAADETRFRTRCPAACSSACNRAPTPRPQCC